MDTDIELIEGLVDNFTKFKTNITDDLSKKGATINQLLDEVQELRAKGGRPQTGAENNITLKGVIAEGIQKNFSKFENAYNTKEKVANIQLSVKNPASITSSNLSGTAYRDFLPTTAGMEPLRDRHFRDIFPVYPSAVDNVSFPRANTPVGEGSFDWQSTEGTPKNQIDRDYTMIDLTLKPLAGYSIVSRQALRNLPFLQSWLPTSMTNGLLKQEDGYFGIQLYQAATGSSTTSGITVAVERLIHFIKNLRKADHNPNVIMVDPDIWATVLTTKPQDYSIPNCVTIDANGNVRILGRPVFEVNWLTEGRVLVGDTSKAGIIQSEGLTMRQSDSHGDIFIQNEIAMLLEVTEALAVFRPDAFIATILS